MREPESQEDLLMASDRSSPDTHGHHGRHEFERWQIIGGTIALVVALVAMVTMSEALQLVESNYSKPFFLRFVVTGGYMFAAVEYAIARLIMQRYAQPSPKLKTGIKPSSNFAGSINKNDDDHDDMNNNDKNSNNDLIINNNNNNVVVSSNITYEQINSGYEDDLEQDLRAYSSHPSTTFSRGATFWQKCKKMFIPGLILNINTIWGGYVWYLSLETTSVSVNNTIYQSQAAFAYIGSALFLGAKVSCQKNVGMLISFAGVVLVSFSDQTSSSEDDQAVNTFGGITWCLVSALMYAAYEIGVKYYGNKLFDPREALLDSLILQFMIGVTAFFCYWPFIIILDVAGVEAFELPASAADWLSVLVPLGLDLIMMSALFVGITLLNSEILAFGQLFIIPLSFLADSMFHGYSVTLNAVLGSLLIIGSFVIMEGPQLTLQECKRKVGLRGNDMNNDIVAGGESNSVVARRQNDKRRNEQETEKFI